MTPRYTSGSLLSQVYSPSFEFYFIYAIVAGLSTAVVDKEDLQSELNSARKLEDVMTLFVEALRHSANMDIWEDLLQRIRMEIRKAEDELSRGDSDKENVDPCTSKKKKRSKEEEGHLEENHKPGAEILKDRDNMEDSEGGDISSNDGSSSSEISIISVNESNYEEHTCFVLDEENNKGGVETGDGEVRRTESFMVHYTTNHPGGPGGAVAQDY